MAIFFLGLLFSLQLPEIDSTRIKEFYHTFSSDNATEIIAGFNRLDSSGYLSQNNACRGAMLMKKSFLEKTPFAKINSFKTGQKLLEAEISKSPLNPEFRFLRLVIQENAPGFLMYNNSIQEDKKIIIEGYNKFNPFLQNFIMRYSNKSRVLTKNDLLQ
jgi:hypothetical protein